MKKQHFGFFIFFAGLIIIFLSPIILLKETFLQGDYLGQFYPWLKIYSQSIKHFQFPFWTDLMQSGFPLMAEGQTGGYYPLNIIMFFLLPFKVAYNYSIIIHFLIAGLFTYFYARKIGADQWGAALSVLLFCFGSNYAGCFYNIVTLRTLCWFPAVLYLLESYFNDKKTKYIIYASIVFGMQLLAGFVQMAIYSGLFYAIYFSYRLIKSGEKKLNLLKLSAIFLIPAIIIWLPQLKLTLELVKLSGRESATLGFALWKSFNPIGIFSLVFPYSFSAFTSNFYIGVLSLYFVIYAFLKRKDDILTKNILLMFFVSIFLSLGQFNPVFVAFLKITKLYSFRVPSKFIFFSGFALALLAGLGFTKLFKKSDPKEEKKAVSIFQIVLILSSFVFVLINLIFNLCKPQLLSLGQWIVNNFIINKPYHRYDLNYYLEKVNVFLRSTAHEFSIHEFYVLSSWIMVILLFFFIKFLIKRRAKLAIFSIIFLDIYIFSMYGTGFRGNIKPFDYLKPKNQHIYNIIKSDKEIFRILPWDLASAKLPLWATANANMAYGINSIAAYTPLVNKNYRDKLIELEIIDDSLGIKIPQISSLAKNFDLIRLLNVKYIISDKIIDLDSLSLESTENGIYLYQLKDYLPKIFFTSGIGGKLIETKAKMLKINIQSPGFISLSTESDSNGFIVFSENYYPGWKAFIDGKICDIIRLEGIIQAVKIDKGKHLVEFKYSPY